MWGAATMSVISRVVGLSIKFYAIQCFKGKASIEVQNGASFGGVGAQFRYWQQLHQSRASAAQITYIDFR
jgi:hypothetical protein